jgi:hypothetical protein
MAERELTRQSLLDLRDEIFVLINDILDNRLTHGKATSTAMVSRLGTLDTAIQAASDFADLT